MRFAGIDIASEKHVVAVVDADGALALKATAFAEDAAGYERVLALLGPANEVLIAMEATGHYWKNLFAVLAAAGHRIALLNPCARIASRASICSAPKPMPSMPWPSPVSPPPSNPR
jgi:hypothetical protein